MSIFSENDFQNVKIEELEKVRVRKHEVDVELLQHCLLGAIKNSGKTKQQVADELDVKFSTVEHYFRKVGSESFSIPSEEHWMPLKKVTELYNIVMPKNIDDVSLPELPDLRMIELEAQRELKEEIPPPKVKALNSINLQKRKLKIGRAHV